MRVKCPRCGYEWEYKGRRIRITCPNCGYTFRIDSVKKFEPRKKDLVEVLVLADYDCLKQVLKESGIEIVESDSGFDTSAIDEELAERIWERITKECVRR